MTEVEEHGPGGKRRKLYSGDERVQETSFNVECVLDDEVTGHVELTEMVACPIFDRKQTTTLVRELSSLFPMQSIHLKRVRNRDGLLHILICSSTDTRMKEGFENVHQDLKELGIKNYEALGAPQLVKVATSPALTRKQFEEGKVHWPMSFHENKELEKKLSGQYFSSGDLAKIKMYIEMAASLAKGTEVPYKRGAVIVDPASDTVITSSTDQRHKHPLHHAAMIAIDIVAKGQLSATTDQPSPSSQAANSDAVPASKSGLPYLCTGYDIFLTHEPCLMCAMALVHSRANRIFFAIPQVDGAVYSKYKLHTISSLNHRFEVHKVNGIMLALPP